MARGPDSGINIKASIFVDVIMVTLSGKHDEVSITFKIIPEEARKLVDGLKKQIAILEKRGEEQ
jgi:hypothetical protein